MEPTQPPPDPAGPPPPPFVRERQARRRRRRRLLLGGTVALVVIGVPVVLLVLGLLSDEGSPIAAGEAESAAEESADEEESGDEGEGGNGADEPGNEGDDPDGDGEEANSEDGDREDGAEPPSRSFDDDELDLGPTDQAGRPDREVPADEMLDPPDVGRLDLAETRIAEMLQDIDASERAMLGYQLDAQSAFSGGIDLDDPQELYDELRIASRIAQINLATLRDRLQTSLDDQTADRVRDTYVIHLDSWVDYLEAIEEDPGLLLRETTRYTVEINRTGDTFTRAAADLLGSDMDGELLRYLRDIADRGFPGVDNPQV